MSDLIGRMSRGTKPIKRYPLNMKLNVFLTYNRLLLHIFAKLGRMGRGTKPITLHKSDDGFPLSTHPTSYTLSCYFFAATPNPNPLNPPHSPLGKTIHARP